MPPSAVVLIVLPAQVPKQDYSYPLRDGWYALAQVVFFVQHLGLLLGLLALGRSAAAGAGRVAVWGVRVAVAGMALLALMELAAIPAAGQVYPSPRTDVLDVGYGVASLLIGAGALAVGIAVLRRGALTGPLRFVPLAIGVYTFVPLTPAIVGPYAVARLAIGGWMLLFALLGWALMSSEA